MIWSRKSNVWNKITDYVLYILSTYSRDEIGPLIRIEEIISAIKYWKNICPTFAKN